MKFSQILSVVLVACLLVTSVPVSADNHETERYYRIGVQSGTTSDTYAADSLPNAEVMGFDTIDLAINALHQGDVDFVLGDLPTLKYYEADSDGLYIAGDFGAEDFGIGVALGESELLDAIDVALGEIIESGQYDSIFGDTFGDEIVVLTDDTTQDTATAYPADPSGTLEFALSSGVLVFGSDTTYPPFESLDDDGNCVGFDCDMADAIAGRMASHYDQVLVAEMKTKTWDELLAFTYDDYDATLSAMTKTAQRAENTEFSRAYYSSKQGILGSEDSHAFISDVSDLNGIFVEDECPFTLDNDDNPCTDSDANPCTDGNHESDACWDYVVAYCDEYDDPGCADIDECPFTLDNANNPCNDSATNPCADGNHESDACWDYVDDYCANYDDPGCYDMGGPVFFVCGDSGEIPFGWVNDGYEDCSDGSDEQQYDATGLRINWFNCHDGSEIWVDQVNDGTDDCADGEDENPDAECPVNDEEWCQDAEVVCDEDSATHDEAACGKMMGEYCTANAGDGFCGDIEEWCGDTIEDITYTEIWDLAIAVQSGTTSDGYAADSLPNAHVMGFDTIDLAIEALKQGDADFVLGDLPTLKYYEADSDGLYVIGDFGAEDFGIGVAPGEETLLDAIDFALTEIIDSGEYDVIFGNTFGDEIVVLTDDTTEYTATAYPADPSGILEFALDSGVLVFGSDTTYPPFESLDDDGNCVGFDCEIADAIAAHIGEFYDVDLDAEMKTKTWDELLAFTYDDYDATLSAMTKTAQRAENTDFSRAYYSSKQGILAGQYSPLITGVEDLNAGMEVVIDVTEEDLAFCTAFVEAMTPPPDDPPDEDANNDTANNDTANNETLEEVADGIPSITIIVSALAVGLVALGRRRH